MLIVDIPTPKHKLTRYSTAQLLAWYETCYLFEAIADEHYDRTGYYVTEHWMLLDVARWTRWDIDDVLQKRGVSDEELSEIMQQTQADVRA